MQLEICCALPFTCLFSLENRIISLLSQTSSLAISRHQRSTLHFLDLKLKTPELSVQVLEACQAVTGTGWLQKGEPFTLYWILPKPQAGQDQKY